jgi:hypothetical protein
MPGGSGCGLSARFQEAAGACTQRRIIKAELAIIARISSGRGVSRGRNDKRKVVFITNSIRHYGPSVIGTPSSTQVDKVEKFSAAGRKRAPTLPHACSPQPMPSIETRIARVLRVAPTSGYSPFGPPLLTFPT